MLVFLKILRLWVVFFMACVFNKGLCISIFGESHSKAIGVVVDNFPFGIEVDLDEIKKDLLKRAPSKNKKGSTKRQEEEDFEIVSGVYNNHTTGAPICAMIYNKNFDSSTYIKLKDFIRPSHADYTAKKRYGFFNDPRGGGNFSGRITAALVFAGSLCKQALKKKKVEIFAHIFSIGKVKDISFDEIDFNSYNFSEVEEGNLCVLEKEKIKEMEKEIEFYEKEGDSIGGVVECGVFNMPVGIGSPIFDGIENFISELMFSIPAVKGIEFGKGFLFGEMSGSLANDKWVLKNGDIKTKTNNNGGILGGISTGMPIIFRVVFKPTPTISKEQETVNLKEMKNEKVLFSGFFDSCIATRGVFVVKAACNIAILSQFIYQGKF